MGTQKKKKKKKKKKKNLIHSILTPSRPVPALTLLHQALGRVTTGVPISMSLQ